jgi:hypothetical protein
LLECREAIYPVAWSFLGSAVWAALPEVVAGVVARQTAVAASRLVDEEEAPLVVV